MIRVSQKSMLNIHKFACCRFAGPHFLSRHLSTIPNEFDFIIVGGGSTGAVLAHRLSEDPDTQVLLLEAGSAPPSEAQIPILCGNLQETTTDWSYTGNAGECGRALKDGHMFAPGGKMLGGTSSMNCMTYVRGHPSDFDSWVNLGNEGWSYDDVLPYFKKSEGFVTSDSDTVIDSEAHGFDGPLTTSVRDPPLPIASAFVEAAMERGFPKIDYNGCDRVGPKGGVSFFQNTIKKDGLRCSSYTAFLEPIIGKRSNLTIVTEAHVTRVLLSTDEILASAKGVEYSVNGVVHTAEVNKEVIISAGAVGSPKLLLLSGIGPREELENIDVPCIVDSPYVGKHLQDHLQLPLIFPAKISPSVKDVVDSIDVLGSHTQLEEYKTNVQGLPSTSLLEAVLWYNTQIVPEHEHTLDVQINMIANAGISPEGWSRNYKLNPKKYFGKKLKKYFSPNSKTCILVGNLVQPKSRGEIMLRDDDPMSYPNIDFNYLSDPEDMRVLVAACKETLAIVQETALKENFGDLLIPRTIAKNHGTNTAADGFWEEWIKTYACSGYNLSSTCRMGDVVDSECRVLGVPGLRVADASIMPHVTSGDINAPCIMIGEKVADMIGREHSPNK